jgi:hypothetical protein
MGSGQGDFITNRLFLPLAAFVYDWTGMHFSPYFLLFLTVVTLAAVVLVIMKNI